MKKFVLSNIFIIIFVTFFSFITVGYALYNESIKLNGNVGIAKAGIVEIINVSVLDSESQNLTDYSTPTFNQQKLELAISSNSKNFTCTILVTVANNSERDYIYTGFSVNAAIEGYDYVPKITSTITNNDSGETISPGYILKSKETTVFKIKLDFSVDQNQGGLTINVSENLGITQDNSGELVASLSPTTGDLRGEGKLAQFELNIMNTYSYRRVITLESSNQNFEIIDQNGTPLSTISIDNNSTNTYQIYLRVKEGSSFLTDTAKTNIILKSNSMNDVNAGELTLLVDIDLLITDHEKPQIGNVTLAIDTINPKEGEATVDFTRLDSGGSSIVNYHIILKNETTGVESYYETGNSIASYTFTNLEEGDYTVKVYGVDEAGNNGAEDCATATASGYCAISQTTNLKWIYNITTNLTNLEYEGNTTALIYSQYSAKIIASYNRTLPNSITIQSNGITLSSGVDYTYDSSTGIININRITGDIIINARAGTSTCLIEGTKIRLADGTYKNIEDIDYDDLLMVYDHENGGITYEYPIWIEREKDTTYYTKITFNDGTTLNTFGHHSVFDIDALEYVLVTDKNKFKIGTNVAKIDEEGNIEIVTVAKIEKVNDNKKYYHVSSTRYHNIIANDILTTDGTAYSGFLYTFTDNLTWGQDREEYLKTKDFFTYEFLAPYFPRYLFEGYRMQEAKNVYNKGLLDINYFAEILTSSNTKELKKDKNNNNLWMVTTTDDVVTKNNKSDFLYQENAYYTLKEPKNKENFIGWLNTGDNTLYQPYDKVKVLYGTHFIAKYQK